MTPRFRNNGGRYGGGISREEADADFLAQVTAVGAEPFHLSGFIPAYQTLTVQVTESIRGGLTAGTEIDLDVLVGPDCRHVAMVASGVRALDPSMIQPGVSLHGWANYEGGRWRAFEISTDGPQYYSGARRW
jgi:hypothetical protein